MIIMMILINMINIDKLMIMMIIIAMRKNRNPSGVDGNSKEGPTKCEHGTCMAEMCSFL
jgi:hypothetical protein